MIITAIEAMLDDRFNLRGVQCSTGIHTPLVIVNGPLSRELKINSGYNCFGQGWRANATIGRAVKLALVNIGGAIPGESNKSTFGHPGAVHLLCRRVRGRQPLGTLPRRGRVRPGRQHGCGLPR